MPYIVVPRLASMSDQERQDFAALRPARLLGEHLSPAEADTMLAAVARLRSDNRTMLIGSRVLLAFMKRNSIEVTPEQQRNISCRPEGTFPGLRHYTFERAGKSGRPDPIPRSAAAAATVTDE